MSSIYKYRVYCQTEGAYVYGWFESEPSTCPTNTGHTITGSATAIVDILDSVGNFDSSGKLLVKSGEVTEFGEQRVSMYNTLFHNYSLYNIINTQVYKQVTISGGTIIGNVNGTEIDINITSTNGSSAILRSAKVCKYRPGYNLILKWNCVFATPVANFLQFGGFGNNGSDVYFCYNGTDFGIRYSTGGYSEVRKLTLTSNALSTNATVVLNGVSYTVPLTNSSGNVNFTAFQVGKFSYSGWLVTSSGNTVIFTAEEVGSKNGTYSYTVSGSSGTFTQTKAGVSLTTTFVNRTNWNGPSRMVQDVDPLKRNMYSIGYTWYGSGNMTFKIFDPDKSIYDTVHTIKFSNITTEPSLSQPNMYLQQGITSLGSTVAKKIRVAGGFAAVEGNYSRDYPIYSVDNSVIVTANVPTVIASIKNRNSIFGFTNNSEILLRQISLNGDGNKQVKIQLVKNIDFVGNTPSDYGNWNFINESESITLYDITSRTYSGGYLLATYYLGKSDTLLIDLTGREITIFKSDILSIIATSTAASEVSLALTIVEDY